MFHLSRYDIAVILAFLGAVLLAASIAALGAGGREAPRRIRTLRRASEREQLFDRRTAKLRRTGYYLFGLAALCGSGASVLATR